MFKLLPLRKKDEEIRNPELYSLFSVILLERITNFIMKTKMDIPDKEGRKRLVIKNKTKFADVVSYRYNHGR